MSEKIAIAADHGGFGLKEFLKSQLISLGYEIVDLGANEYDKDDNFPSFSAKMADVIKNEKASKGILICGTGIGMSIAINRYDFIRGALIHDSFTARLSRLHNDANVVVLGGRVIGEELALDCVKEFLKTEFLGGKYQDRMEQARSC